ncbi:uncharacterized protein LOC110100996 [Dendrobium catenatum]|uniref:uncharacterized protein LOC110100996 n=1 Tax=Dendrobium catenatum TaxID=906689 RepID=UPI0009F713CF|nr:uncharacterized protein LOC110100996 [Dendrobium catenatum]
MGTGVDWLFSRATSVYESLLSAIRKVWKLKGMMKLLSLSDGFFMLKFTAHEDYDMALSGGVWFFLGKPFVLQKWVPNFKPVREEFTSIPIWFKILDLPLPCWTPEGISRIASKIGTPIAVDNLTAEKLGSREPFSLRFQYEWKPAQCEHCGSIVHTPDFCSSKPEPLNTDFQSRKPPRAIGRNPNFKPKQPLAAQQNVQSSEASDPMSMPSSSTAAASLKISDLPASSTQPTPSKPQLNFPTPTVVATQQLNNTAETTFITIPNLNSPTEESIPSSSTIIQQQDKVISPNKFDIL